MLGDRAQSRYCRVEEMINMIDEPNRTICLKIMQDHGQLMCIVPGSSHKHQAWPGGYYDHIRETMNIGLDLYRTMCLKRVLPFSRSDMLFILFLHDIEKLWKYEMADGQQLSIKPELQDKAAQREFRERLIAEYGIVLTDEQRNGLTYVEGEGNDYSPTNRVMGPLAALCHMADVASARLWPDHPTQHHDAWRGAHRVATHNSKSSP